MTQWTTNWTAIKGAQSDFDTITEELIDPDRLVSSSTPFVSAIGSAYKRYAATLLASNRLDFAHQQKLVFELLGLPHSDTTGISDLQRVQLSTTALAS